MKNVKRVGLYFNLDNPVEYKMWQYLESKRSKSSAIKDLLEKVTSGNDIEMPESNVDKIVSNVDNTKAESIEIENDLTIEDLDGIKDVAMF